VAAFADDAEDGRLEQGETPLGSQLNPAPPPVSTTFPAMSDPWRTTPSGWVASDCRHSPRLRSLPQRSLSFGTATETPVSRP
jgi:hypothetical protein